LILERAQEAAQKKRDTFSMNAHVLKDERGEYFTVLDINLKVMLESNYQLDKTIYYTAWFTTK
jgi:hypothetical protein